MKEYNLNIEPIKTDDDTAINYKWKKRGYQFKVNNGDNCLLLTRECLCIYNDENQLLRKFDLDIFGIIMFNFDLEKRVMNIKSQNQLLWEYRFVFSTRNSLVNFATLLNIVNLSNIRLINDSIKNFRKMALDVLNNVDIKDNIFNKAAQINGKSKMDECFLCSSYSFKEFTRVFLRTAFHDGADTQETIYLYTELGFAFESSYDPLIYNFSNINSDGIMPLIEAIAGQYNIDTYNSSILAYFLIFYSVIDYFHSLSVANEDGFPVILQSPQYIISLYNNQTSDLLFDIVYYYLNLNSYNEKYLNKIMPYIVSILVKWVDYSNDFLSAVFQVDSIYSLMKKIENEIISKYLSFKESERIFGNKYESTFSDYMNKQLESVRVKREEEKCQRDDQEKLTIIEHNNKLLDIVTNMIDDFNVKNATYNLIDMINLADFSIQNYVEIRNKYLQLNNISQIKNNIIGRFALILKSKYNISQDLYKDATWCIFNYFVHERFASEWLGTYLDKNDSVSDDQYTQSALDDDSLSYYDNDTIKNFTYYISYLAITANSSDPEFIKVLMSSPDIVMYQKTLQKCKEHSELLKDNYFEERLFKKHNPITSVGYTINDVDLMSGYEFEEFISKLFIKLGYSSYCTPKSGDQGIDVIAEKNGVKYGIQAKCYVGNVGNSAIQEAVAGKMYYNCDKVIVVTNSRFTQSAVNLAKCNSVILWDRSILSEKIMYFN